VTQIVLAVAEGESPYPATEPARRLAAAENRRHGRSLGGSKHFHMPQLWFWLLPTYGRIEPCRHALFRIGGAVGVVQVGSPTLDMRKLSGRVHVSSCSDVDAGRNQHRFDAAIKLAREEVVSVRYLLERYAMGDELVGLNVPRPDVFHEARQMALDAGLVHPKRQALVYGIADWHGVEGGPVDPHDGDCATLADRVDCPVKDRRGAGLHFELHPREALQCAAGGFTADAVDADVCTKPVGHFLDVDGHVVDRLEVDGLTLRKVSDKFEAVLQVINDDHATRAKQPRGLRRKDADRARPEDNNRVAFSDAAHLCSLVACRKRVGQHHRVFEQQLVRDFGGSDIGERDAHELRLASIEAPSRMRVPVNAANGCCLWIGVVAVAIQLALAEVAASAKDVEGNQHAIAALEVLHGLADVNNCADELVSESGANARVWYQTVIQMQIRTANTGAQNLNNGIVGMLDDRVRFLGRTDAVGAAVIQGKHDSTLRSGNRSSSQATCAVRP